MKVTSGENRPELRAELVRVGGYCADSIQELLDEQLRSGSRIQDLLGLVFNGSNPEYKIVVLPKDKMKEMDPASYASERMRPALTTLLQHAYADDGSQGLLVVILTNSVYGVVRLGIINEALMSPGGSA